MKALQFVVITALMLPPIAYIDYLLVQLWGQPASLGVLAVNGTVCVVLTLAALAVSLHLGVRALHA